MNDVAERHLRRIVDATNFEDTFASIDLLVDEAGPAEALRLALLWSSESEPQIKAAGLDVLASLVQQRDDLHDTALRQAAAVSAADPDENLR